MANHIADSSSETPTAKRPRFRFSILAMLGLVALIAVGLTVWKHWIAWPAAQGEFRELCIGTPSPEAAGRFKTLIQRYPKLIQEPNVIVFATGYGDVELYQWLLDRGAPLHKDVTVGQSPLFYAIYGNHVEMVRMLLKKGIKAKGAESASGLPSASKTPLHLAARRGHLEICRLLVDSGADVNAETTEGVRPLFESLLSGNPEVVRFLLDRDATFASTWKVNSYRETIEQTGFAEYFQGPTAKRDREEVIRLLEERLPLMQSEA